MALVLVARLALVSAYGLVLPWVQLLVLVSARVLAPVSAVVAQLRQFGALSKAENNSQRRMMQSQGGPRELATSRSVQPTWAGATALQIFFDR